MKERKDGVIVNLDVVLSALLHNRWGSHLSSCSAPLSFEISYPYLSFEAFLQIIRQSLDFPCKIFLSTPVSLKWCGNTNYFIFASTQCLHSYLAFLQFLRPFSRVHLLLSYRSDLSDRFRFFFLHQKILFLQSYGDQCVVESEWSTKVLINSLMVQGQV